tara:strand:+ start:57 stop:338 length:282 start_codon:yes stop_codon:yes gene_type:complete
MDSQLPTNQESLENQITPEQLEQMKQIARQRAVQQIVGTPVTPQQQKIVYVRRNLTVAEVIAVFIISCGIVFGVQFGWNFATNILPRIEVKVN